MIGFEEATQIDFERLAEVGKSLRGHSEKEVAAAIGVNARHFWRLKKGSHFPSEKLIARVAQYARSLGIDPSDLTANENPKWVSFPLSDLARLADFHAQLRRSEEVLTISRSVDSYVQEKWMLEWSNRVWLGIRDWDAHKNITYPYAQQQIDARRRANFIHRLVCPWELFEAAKNQNDYWLAELRHGIGEYGEVSLITPVRDWGRLCRSIGNLLPYQATGWTKVTIVDSVRILIHVNQSFCVSSFSESNVRSLLTSIDRIVKEIEPSFLGRSDIRPTKMKEASYETQKRVETLLREPSDAERGHFYLDVFDKMLSGEEHWVSASVIHRRTSEGLEERIANERRRRIGYVALRESENGT